MTGTSAPLSSRTSRASAADLIRFPFTWATVQPDSPNTWDWAVYDRIFAAAASGGSG